MPKQLLLGTSNQGKQKEMRALFTLPGINLRTPEDLSLSISVAETGKTYAQNALLKARAFRDASGLPSLADDTGLEVDALDGAPGLYSARFSPKVNATDADRRALLLSKLRQHSQPWNARFTCTMALALPDGRTFIQTGTCEGEISPTERGETGFGYDQVFLITAVNRTMAELGMGQKNRLSHRAKAAEKMLKILPEILG